MSKAEPASRKGSYQLKISLLGIRPQIWRRVLVPIELNLAYLHTVIQITMGWQNSHLHQFHAGGKRYSDPEFGFSEHDKEVLDETKTYLYEVAPRVRSVFYYEYDFGDGWAHRIAVEKKLAQVRLTDIRCIGGERACPPEDSGGIFGYKDLLRILANKKHPEYRELREWAGRSFNPEKFSIGRVNRELKRTFVSQRGWFPEDINEWDYRPMH